MKIFIFFFTLCLFNLSCNPPSEKINYSSSLDTPVEKMRGISLVAPARPFTNNPMEPLNAIGTDWITIMPFAFSPVGEPRVSFNSARQWWGERPEGVVETIRLARK